MIRKSKRPLLLIGAGANRGAASNALTQFIEKTGIYFFNTQMGKGVIDERHPLFLGTAALSSDDFIHCAIEKADLIINVGHDVVEKPPFYMEKGGTKVIHINYSSAAIGADGTIYVGSSDSKIYAIYSGSWGLANTPWPMFRNNVSHTGNTEINFSYDIDRFAQSSDSSTFTDEFDDGDVAPGGPGGQ